MTFCPPQAANRASILTELAPTAFHLQRLEYPSMPPQFNLPARMDIADSPSRRLMKGGRRAIGRRCPYCGTDGVFRSWFAVKDRCPHCATKYAYETGYFLGAYAINLVFTELLAVAIVVSLIAFTDLSVLQMQIIAVVVAIGLPLLFYPTALLLWIALDIAFHPPDKHTGRQAI
jgi:uncharacterized protein (DUF983 family)